MEAGRRQQAPDFRVGLVANYAAMGVVGLSGIIVNLVVAFGFGASGLGLFSQTYLVFVVAAQPATAGIHYAVLRSVSTSEGSSSSALAMGVRLVVPIASAVALLVAASSPLLAAAADSDGLRLAVALAAPGLVFHALNKVMLAYLNGRRSMTAFAAFQAGRVVLLAAAVTGVVVATDDARWLGLALLVSEASLSLAIVASGTLRSHTAQDDIEPGPPIAAAEFLQFGIRSFGGGLLQELNARVDVLTLSLLVSDREVGVYTLAATATEGAFQLLIVLRNNINPLLARSLAARRAAEVERLARSFRLPVYAVGLAGWLAVLVLYRPIVDASGLSADFRDAWVPLLILLGGLGLVAGLLPFDQIFLLGGHPGLQTVVVAGVIGANLLLNLSLIPAFGLEGAALSTAASFVGLGVAIWLFARRSFGVRLL